MNYSPKLSARALSSLVRTQHRRPTLNGRADSFVLWSIATGESKRSSKYDRRRICLRWTRSRCHAFALDKADFALADLQVYISDLGSVGIYLNPLLGLCTPFESTPYGEPFSTLKWVLRSSQGPGRAECIVSPSRSGIILHFIDLTINTLENMSCLPHGWR